MSVKNEHIRLFPLISMSLMEKIYHPNHSWFHQILNLIKYFTICWIRVIVFFFTLDLFQRLLISLWVDFCFSTLFSFFSTLVFFFFLLNKSIAQGWAFNNNYWKIINNSLSVLIIITSRISSKQLVSSQNKILTILHLGLPFVLDSFPSAILIFLIISYFLQRFILNWASPPHLRSLGALSSYFIQLLNRNRCVWPLLSSFCEN